MGKLFALTLSFFILGIYGQNLRKSNPEIAQDSACIAFQFLIADLSSCYNEGKCVNATYVGDAYAEASNMNT